MRGVEPMAGSHQRIALAECGWLRRIEALLSYGSACCILAIMIIVVVDVAMRYGFNAPLPWAFDLVGMYLLVGAFYLALPTSHAEDSHVRVDIVAGMCAPKVRRFFEVISCGCGALFLGGMAYVGYERTVIAFVGNEVVVGLIPWPTWLSVVFVPIGAGLLSFRLMIVTLAHAISLFTSRELVPLPRTSEQHAMSGDHKE